KREERRERRLSMAVGTPPVYLSLATRGGERRAPHGVLLTQPSPPAASLLPFVSPARWIVGLSSVSDGGDAADGGTAGRVALTGVLALESLGGLVSGRFLLAKGSPFHKRPLPVLGEHG
ncbi:unnamed protein product, partial [Musa acuminata var. zebrina]